MIIDFIGAPGVGKSTFARELAARLDACGRLTTLISSYRPTEIVGSGQVVPNCEPGHIRTLLHRLSRPATELMANAWSLPRGSGSASLVDALLMLLPPRGLISSIRLQQYLLRLAYSWRAASEAERIILFDQGFLQALCSLVVLGGSVGEEQIAEAVELLPPANLVVHLTAPVTVLEQRLRERNAQQGRMERLLELSVRANLSFVPVIERICELWRRRDHRILRVDCTDTSAMSAEVARATREVVNLRADSLVA